MKPLSAVAATACTAAGLLGWLLAPPVGHAGPPTDDVLRTYTTDNGVIARLIYDADAANPLDLCGPGVVISGPKGLDGDMGTYARYTHHAAQASSINARQYSGELSSEEAKKARETLGPNPVAYYTSVPPHLGELRYDLWVTEGALPGVDPYELINAYAVYDQHAVLGLDITYPDGTTKAVRGIYVWVDPSNLEYFL